MSQLVGGVAGAQASVGGGLLSTALRVGEQPAGPFVRPFMPQPTLNPTQPFPNIGRFRRHISNITTDALNNVLAGVTVLLFDWGTKLLVGSVVSDTNGIYDFPLYVQGTTYFIYANKAGTPEVFGGSSNQLVGL